ncbi:MAG: UxaA family hydrolase [Gracilibacteraceae bacterium]|nr:UxaA family hydrolase [Gracilibacteraceae bacterium]
MNQVFRGYRRADGGAGARNTVAVIPSVFCANVVVEAVTRQVINTAGILHHQGCCQLKPDLDLVTACLIGIGRNPNVGAALIVSLGCEGVDAEEVAAGIRQSGKPAETVYIQKGGGTVRAIAQAVQTAQELSRQISAQPREDTDLSHCVMSIKCGASDATSGMASNCVIGYVADRLVDLGGTVIFGETTEFIGAEHILAGRAADPACAQAIYGIVADMEARANRVGVDMRRGQPTPGNIQGGLTTIEEKSLGAIVKSGSRPIQGVLRYEDSAAGKRGLWIKDTPGRELEILTGMAVAGSQCMLFSTGRGAPQGFPVMPVLKICGNPHTFAAMPADMDVNAGEIIEGKKSIEEVGEEVLRELIAVLSGKTTKCETIGYTNLVDFYTKGPVI